MERVTKQFSRGGAKIVFLLEGLHPIKGLVWCAFCKIHIKHSGDGGGLVTTKKSWSRLFSQQAVHSVQAGHPKHTRKSFSEHQVKFPTSARLRCFSVTSYHKLFIPSLAAIVAKPVIRFSGRFSPHRPVLNGFVTFIKETIIKNLILYSHKLSLANIKCVWWSETWQVCTKMETPPVAHTSLW